MYILCTRHSRHFIGNCAASSCVAVLSIILTAQFMFFFHFVRTRFIDLYSLLQENYLVVAR